MTKRKLDGCPSTLSSLAKILGLTVNDFDYLLTGENNISSGMITILYAHRGALTDLCEALSPKTVFTRLKGVDLKNLGNRIEQMHHMMLRQQDIGETLPEFTPVQLNNIYGPNPETRKLCLSILEKSSPSLGQLMDATGLVASNIATLLYNGRTSLEKRIEALLARQEKLVKLCEVYGPQPVTNTLSKNGTVHLGSSIDSMYEELPLQIRETRLPAGSNLAIANTNCASTQLM